MLPNALLSILWNSAKRCYSSAWLADAGLLAAVTTALASEGISSGRGCGWALLAAEALPPPAITKSDAAFAAEGLEFVVGHETVSLTELNDLFERVLPPAMHIYGLFVMVSICTGRKQSTRSIQCCAQSRQGPTLSQDPPEHEYKTDGEGMLL